MYTVMTNPDFLALHTVVYIYVSPWIKAYNYAQ